MNYKAELLKMIDYLLDLEQPYEKSWIYAVKLKKRIIEEERKDKNNGVL